MRLIYTLVLILILGQSCCFSTEEDKPKSTQLYVVKKGKGAITLENSGVTKACEFFPVPSPEKVEPIERDSSSHKLFRLKGLPTYKEDILRSWDPKNFTDLSSLSEGTTLSQDWKMIVHGLEVGDLEPSILHQSMFGFALNQLKGIYSDMKIGENESGYVVEDFVPYYPRTFLSTPVTATSIVSANLGATFGQLGFCLRVPPQNLVVGSFIDMHTPTGKDFYESKAMNGMSNLSTLITEKTLRDMSTFIPKKPFLLKDGTRGEEYPFSYYTELAIVPLTEKGTEVEISGVFYRSMQSWEDFKKDKKNGSFALEMEKLAKQFDLPIVQICDGHWFCTDV